MVVVSIYSASQLTILNVSSQTTLCFHLADVGATVERISYGERIVLRPAPPPSERLYEKGWLCSVKIRIVHFNFVFSLCDEILFFVRTAWPQRPIL